MALSALSKTLFDLNCIESLTNIRVEECILI